MAASFSLAKQIFFPVSSLTECLKFCISIYETNSVVALAINQFSFESDDHTKNANVRSLSSALIALISLS